jgi:putative ABC transport system ATP-binding protein
MPDPFVRVRELTKTYNTPAGPLNVLRGVDIDLVRGDFVAFVGPSGSGKTTFLNMITGIDSPSSGSVLVDEIDVVNASEKRLTKWRGRNIGIVFQFFQLLPTISVLQNIMMPMDFCNVYRPRERRERAMQLLERFDVAEQAHKTPDMLSGGQQQRVAIARALANDPPLVIGDEPTGNLDRASAAVVFDTFFELQDSGHTVVVVTHDRELAKNVPKKLTISDGLLEASTLEAAAKRRTQELRSLRLRDM